MSYISPISTKSSDNKLKRGSRAALLASVASVAVFASASHVYAQDADSADAVEEIVVSGIRGSLRRAMDVKRNNSAIVDAISAEDIGKFPDQNVAESLQRISGVSIDRSGGEGQFVTVRGFGPQFNTVLVNGRILATENEGREYSFDSLAAELISGADVYKTPTAGMQSGGIGSTINIRTARPLDTRGFTAAVSTKAQYEDNSDELSPTLSGLVSNTFADDTIGLLLSFSHQERDSRTDFIDTRGFNPGTTLNLADGTTLEDVFIPQNYDQIVNFEKRKRTGGTAVLQFEPSDTFRVTLDALYSKFDVESKATSIGHWFTSSEVLDAAVDENNTVVTLTHSGNGATDYINRTYNRPTETKMAGFNTDWQASDNLNIAVDLAWSEATSDNGGNETFAVIGFNNGVSYDNTNPDTIPSLTGVPATLDPADGRAHIALREGADIVDEVIEAKFDAEWSMDGILNTVKFGGYMYERTKTNNTVATDPNVLCLYCGYASDVDDSLLTEFDAGNFLGAEGQVPTVWLDYDPDALFAFLESPEAIAGLSDPETAAALIAANNGYAAALQPDSFEVDEEVYGGYVDFNFEGDFGDKVWAANIGLRYVHTKQTATGKQLALLDLEVIPDDETLYNAVFSDTVIDVTESNTYNDLLPSANFRLDMTEELILRASYSRTITRPTMTDMAPRVNFAVNRPGNLQANGGNPLLSPFKSDNLDLTAEYYYGDASYLSVAGFHKTVDDFIVSTVEQETFALESGSFTYNVRRPRNGETAKVKGLEVSWQHSFDSLPAPFDGLGIQANLTFVDSAATLDTGNTSTTFALEGLGDSQNLVVFYEKDRIQFRVAYNNRDGFMQTLANGTGGDPIFVEAYHQIDLSGSYDLTDDISVFFEGTNITNQDTRKHGRFENQMLSVSDNGARYAVGIRAKF